MAKGADSPFFDISTQVKLGEAVARREAPESPCAACSVRHLTVCHALAAEELHHMASIVANVELDPGDPLFDEGEDAVNVFNVTAAQSRSTSCCPTAAGR